MLLLDNPLILFLVAKVLFHSLFSLTFISDNGCAEQKPATSGFHDTDIHVGKQEALKKIPRMASHLKMIVLHLLVTPLLWDLLFSNYQNHKWKGYPRRKSGSSVPRSILLTEQGPKQNITRLQSYETSRWSSACNLLWEKHMGLPVQYVSTFVMHYSEKKLNELEEWR